MSIAIANAVLAVSLALLDPQAKMDQQALLVLLALLVTMVHLDPLVPEALQDRLVLQVHQDPQAALAHLLAHGLPTLKVFRLQLATIGVSIVSTLMHSPLLSSFIPRLLLLGVFPVLKPVRPSITARNSNATFAAKMLTSPVSPRNALALLGTA